MIALIDTHVLIWWLAHPSRIPPATRECLVLASNQVLVSAATAWEIAVKRRIGKLEFDSDFLSNFDDRVRALGFEPLAVSASHAVRGAEINASPKDPFDRMLAGQAVVEGVTMVTADPAFDALGVKTWWR